MPDHSAKRKRATSKLIRPHPINPTWVVFLPSCKHRAARAALAAVLLALMIELSAIISGLPVCDELMIKTAEARSSPISRFPGKEDIHFTPAMLTSPPRYAGNAMILLLGLKGKRKNTE